METRSKHDKETIRKVLADILRMRQALARRGVKLKDILRPGESLRDLMHRGHRF